MSKRHRSHYETSAGNVTEETCFLRIIDNLDDTMDHLLMMAHLRSERDPLLGQGFIAVSEMMKLIRMRFVTLTQGKLNREALADIARKLQ